MGLTWSDVGKAVSSVAPVLGAALGGPVGVVASAAGSLVAKAFGVEDTPESVSANLSGDNLIRLKEIEAANQEQLLLWQKAQLEADLANVQSARDREVELAKAGHGASWSTSIVAFIVTAGFFVILYVLLVGGKSELGDAGLMLLGSLSTAFGSVVNYYLGSSLGSASKDSYLRSKK